MKSHTILLFSILFLLSSFSPPAKGFSYTSADGKVSASFPSEYTEKVTDGETYTTTQITSTVEGQSYMVSFTIHETDLSEEEGLEDISLNAFANAIAGDIQTKETWTYKGLEGVKARMYSEESTAYVDYIVIFKGDIQYQFACYALSESWTEKKATAFFKTIKIQ